MNQRLKNLLFFSKKDAQLEKRIQHEYLDGDLAVLACKVEGVDDIISRYSVPGYETLNPEFVDYIKDGADYIPPEYPIVLEITGRTFSEPEQEVIKGTIEGYFAFELGDAQADARKGKWVFVCTLIGMIITAIIMQSINDSGSIWHECIYLAFWFFADFVYRFILGGEVISKKSRIRAARLSSIQVRFEKDFTDVPYTREETDEIVSNMMEGKT